MHLERNFFGNAIDLPSSIVITIILKQIKESEAVKSFLLTLPPPPSPKKAFTEDRKKLDPNWVNINFLSKSEIKSVNHLEE